MFRGQERPRPGHVTHPSITNRHSHAAASWKKRPTLLADAALARLLKARGSRFFLQPRSREDQQGERPHPCQACVSAIRERPSDYFWDIGSKSDVLAFGFQTDQVSNQIIHLGGSQQIFETGHV